MRGAWFISALLLALVAASFVERKAQRGAPTFAACDIIIDCGERSLGAYQIELTADRPGAKVVGVEGGDHPEFKNAPYYDPAALSGGRIVVGALSLADAKSLPTGEFRAARVHFMLEDPQTGFTVKVHTAGDERGAMMDVQARAQRAPTK
ncbi:MAG: hypothetical protein ACOYN0_12380 [Phycisphaerales bacterium]